MLDAVYGIVGAVPVMEGQGEPLHVVEEFCPEIPNQLLPGIGLQIPTR